MISAIIVNHNHEVHLTRCLASLGSPRPELEVLLVDNASEDGSLELVQRDFSHVRVFAEKRNLGFGAANNLAVSEAKGDRLLLLNADAQLGGTALERMSRHLESNPQIGLVASSLRYPGGRRQFSRSPARGVLGEILQRLFNPFEARAWAHGRIARQLSRIAGPAWYTAACVLVRAEAFREIGGFDERFFLYYEDVDFCLRLKEAGWNLAQETRAIVDHAGGLGRGSVADDLYRPSQLLYYRLHRPRWEAAFLEHRLRRRFGDAVVDKWLPGRGCE